MKISSVYFLIVFMYLFLGAFYSIDDVKFIVFAFMLILLLINFIFIINRFKLGHILINNKLIFFAFLTSFFFMLISSIYNSSLELFMGGLNFLFCFLFFSLNYPIKKMYEVFEFSTKSLFIVFTIINVYFGLSFPFMGVFSNPNSLGGLYTTIAVLAAGVFIDKYRDLGKSDFFLLAIMLFSVIFSLFSNSRSSFIVSSLFFIIAIFYRYGFFIQFKNNNIFINTKMFIYFFILSIISFVLLNLSFNYIYDIFISKVIYKINIGATDGRSDVWKLILDNMRIFGHGRDSIHLEATGLAAHNTFFSILDQFGFLAAFLFLISCIYCLFSYLQPKVILRYGVIPFFIILGFILMSISESMINKSIMFALFAILNLKVYRSLNVKF